MMRVGGAAGPHDGRVRGAQLQARPTGPRGHGEEDGEDRKVGHRGREGWWRENVCSVYLSVKWPVRPNNTSRISRHSFLYRLYTEKPRCVQGVLILR